MPPCQGILARVREEQGRREEARKLAQTLLRAWRDSAVEIPEIALARRIPGAKQSFLNTLLAG